jgi:hypothetical protein
MTRQIICDDLGALRRADATLVPGTSDLLSVSPALVLGDGAPSVALDAVITSADITKLFDWTLDLAAATATKINEAGLDETGDAAYLAARTIIQLQPALYLAVCLSRLPRAERDFVTVDYADADFDRRFNGMGAALAASLPGITIRRVADPAGRVIDPPAPPGATVRERLRFNPLSSHVFRIGSALWDRIGATPAKGTIFIHRENELLKECAYHLLRRGYAVRRLPISRRTATPTQSDDVLVADIRGIVRDAAMTVFPDDHADAVSHFVADHVVSEITALAGRADEFGVTLDDLDEQRPRCVLTNFVGSLDTAALHAACRSRAIPMIHFQHGVTAEICQPMAKAWPVLEAAAGDLVCTYDQALAALNDAAPHRRARSVAAGMPSEMRRSISRRVGSPTREVWYVSTGLSRGRTAMLHVAEPDHRIARFEIDIIDTVLNDLPHPVVFKPYPAVRYTDGDPVAERATRTPGIRVHDGRGDFRFLAARCGVIVTARATSTLSWCLMSSRPVVFIDIPTQMPLRPEVRRLAEQALFLFDAGDPAMATNLRAFLSRPIADIEADWRERAPARAALIEAFFDTDSGPAGQVAATAVETLLEDFAA